MATDDERRRIAAALREYASFDHECEDEEEFSVDCADWGERVINLLDCGDTEEECYAYLADLIEPGEQKVKCVAEVKVDGERLEKLAHDAAVELTGLDRDALIELADEMGRVRSKCDFCIKKGDCDWADEAICLESHIDDYAQRIREALGMFDDN